MNEKVLIITTVSPDAVEAILEAISKAGGGRIGHYTHCAFTSEGLGRFMASDAAKPHVGAAGKINQEPEIRIESFCQRKDAKAVLAAIREAHPYEEAVIYLLPLLTEDEL